MEGRQLREIYGTHVSTRLRVRDSVVWWRKFDPPSETVSSAGTTPHSLATALRDSSARLPSVADLTPSVMVVSLASLEKYREAVAKQSFSVVKVVSAGRLLTSAVLTAPKLLPLSTTD